MSTNFELIKEFHAAFGNFDPERPINLNMHKDLVKLLSLRINLIKEEYTELMVELENANSMENIAKELTDLLVVVYGTGAALGINLDNCYREVHRSNMSKLGEDGLPIRREDGKILKGNNYSPADMKKILNL